MMRYEVYVMQKKIEQFCNLNKEIHEELNIGEHVYLSSKLNIEWKVLDLGDLKMIEFGKNNIFEKCVIVNNEKEPLIIKKEKYTIIVAIDCVKIAFIFDNNMEIK